MKVWCYLSILVVLLSLSISRTTSSLPPKKPNVIIILTDDLGYADLGSQNQEDDVRTPNLDRFSSEGIRFTAGYVSAPQCAPSRAGIVTGRYQQRFGIGHNPDMPLPLEAITIAERLKPAGYISSHIGKWGLTPNAQNSSTLTINLKKLNVVTEEEKQRFMPKEQGFDDYFTGQKRKYYINFDLNGERVGPEYRYNDSFRVDVQVVSTK